MKIAGLMGWAMRSAPRSLVPCPVPYVRATDPENYIFCDVRGMVRNAFQIPGDGKSIQRLHGAVRLGLHEAGESGKCFVVHAVDFIVGLKYVPRELRITLNK